MLKLKTVKLQEMVSRAVKGCGNNKMIPITSLLAIRLSNHKLSLITTDAINYMYIEEDKVDGMDFYVVVQADMFSKLISRMTSEHVTLDIQDNNLCVEGNGKYKIELPLNEEGNLIKFPDPIASVFTESVQTVQLSTIKLLLEVNKAALAQSLDVPCYTGYYMGDNVVTTDTYKMCGTAIKIFDTPVLLSASMMDALDVMTDETIQVIRDGDTLVFTTPDCKIYGKALEGIDDFQIDAINGLLGEEFESNCTINKSDILQVLDRLALFVSPYDKNGIYLTFTQQGVMLSSKKSSGTELVPYRESANFMDFTCCIDIEMLRSQIKAHSADSIKIYYGKENAIKIVDANVTQIIALEVDDRIS